ncbi:MAG: nucleoside deaminase [Terricaulis sp.]|nr:nucleoside deaminase [Terricaulis sp.]
MGHALALAARAAEAGEAPIGALIVDAAGAVIADGANAPIALRDPTAHAEIIAIRRAAQALGNYRLKPGLTLYVTLEPCAMCAGAISAARIARLVYAAPDAKGGAIAHGPRYFEQPTCHWRPSVSTGLRSEESAEMLRAFFKARR